MGKPNNLLKEEGGQALTEYALVISLIVLVVIITLVSMGTKLAGSYEYISNKF